MEYILVVVVGDEKGGRGVLVDGQPNGKTHEIIGIGEGLYTISLQGPSDYSPASRQVTVSDTLPLRPLKVFFYANR